MDGEFEDKLEYYISIGAIELVGMDENGEVIYKLTDKAEELAPELMEAHQEYIDKTLLELYEKNLISIEYNENLEAIISISPEGIEIAREYGLIDMENIEEIPND
jgi:hypothetical protein